MKWSRIRVKDALKELPVGTYESIVSQTRANYLARWMERTVEIGKPCESASDIDYSDPYIHIEWLLCDLNNLRWAKSKKERNRARWYAQLTTEEIAVFDAEYKDALLKKSFRKEVSEEVAKQKKG